MPERLRASNRTYSKPARACVFLILTLPLLAQKSPDCSTIKPRIENGRIIAPNREECVLRADDAFHLEGDGNEHFNPIRISPTGTFKLPLIGEISAEGLTLSELEHLINQKLSPFIKNPDTTISYNPTVKLETYRVVGQVGRPGLYVATPQLKLSDALERAAVFASSKKCRIRIVRTTGLIYKIKSTNAATDLFIEPGDLISVSF